MDISRHPAGHFLFGNMREFTQDSLAFLLDIRRYGDFVEFKFGPFSLYTLNHPDLVHEVLVTQSSKFYKDRVTKQVMEPTVGQGVFTSDGEAWKKQRKLVQPAFHFKRIAGYADVIVQFSAELARRWQPNTAQDVERDMTALTMRIISKTMFDADVTGDIEEVSEAMSDVLKITNDRFNRLIPIPDWLPTKENRSMKKAVHRLNTIIQRFIDERRKNGEDKGDLLSMLLMAQGEDGSGMSDKQVSDEAKTLFGAGHETTAAAMTWAWYLISQHPEVEAKLQAELDTVLGGRLPTFDDLPNLPYTEMVIKETMRLYPPAFSMTRQAHEEVTIAGNTFPKDTLFLVNVYGIQRDSRFFDNPDAFIPERFSEENEKRIPKYAYLPFGAGPRICVGNMFAMMEGRLILATIAQKLRLSPVPRLVVEPQRIFTVRPKYGLTMTVTEHEKLGVI